MKRSFKNLPVWTPFARAEVPPLSDAEMLEKIQDITERFPNISADEAKATFADLVNDMIVLNSRYQVNIRIMPDAGMGDICHLSIKRIDKERVGRERYRDFMRIKDELIGPEYEAVEIYPARSDEVDTANQYHLWVMLQRKLPFGWHGARMVDGKSAPGGKQEPFE